MVHYLDQGYHLLPGTVTENFFHSPSPLFTSHFLTLLLLSFVSYLGAKWAGEALCQGLRMEMRLRQLPIDCVMVSPGIVKPTRLAEEGKALLERTFSEMPPEATTEYREMVDAFQKFQVEEPGTHVSVVGQQMEKIMRHGKPWMRYFVGFDAVAATIVGILPTGLREHLLRNTLMMHFNKIPRLFFK